jgi:SWI/SNF-related matrix-associated actin-dependent regulator 1 of chromatin subfamily A
MSGANNSQSLSQEQLSQIAKNRLVALEKLRKRQAEENAQTTHTPTTEDPNRKPEKWPIRYSPPAKHSKVDRPHPHLPEKTTVVMHKEPIKLQLDSPSTFLVTGGTFLGTLMRDFARCTFDIQEKAWRLPLSDYHALLDRLPETDKPRAADRIPEKVVDLLLHAHDDTGPAPFDDLRYLDAPIRNTLFPFQREGIVKVLRRGGRIILADDMGLGKSIQAIGIACYYRLEWPLLIVTPASMVATWHEQLGRWLQCFLDLQDVNVVYDGKQDVRRGIVVIVSYDLAVRLADALKERRFRVVIADESHAFRNHSTKRAKFMLPLLKKANRVILLSGTPALSRPEELHSQITAVNPKLFPKFFDYGMRYIFGLGSSVMPRYCAGFQDRFGPNFKGKSNLRELQLVLESTVMIRRTKDQVLRELPRKQRQQVFLRVGSKDLRELDRQTEQLTASDAQAGTLEALFQRAEYLAIWKRTGEVKLPAMLEYVQDLLDGRPQKILLFAHHMAILDAFQEHLARLKVCSVRIDGQTPPKDRQDLCSQFQRDEHIRIALLSITAASVGMMLFLPLLA